MTKRSQPPSSNKPLTSSPVNEQDPSPSLQRIWQETAENDGLLPSEKVLATQLGIGRNSVRELLIRLEAEGFVSRRQGVGTFANPAALDVQIRIDRTAEFADILREAGIRAEVEVLESHWASPPIDGFQLLRARPTDSIFVTRKRWLADGVPVMLADDIVPARRQQPVDPTLSVFEIALALNGRATQWVCSWIEPVVAGPLAELLDCAPTQPILRMEQVGVARDGARCWAATEHHNPSRHTERLRYGLVRTVGRGLDGESSRSPA